MTHSLLQPDTKKIIESKNAQNDSMAESARALARHNLEERSVELDMPMAPVARMTQPAILSSGPYSGIHALNGRPSESVMSTGKAGNGNAAQAFATNAEGPGLILQHEYDSRS